MTSRPTRLSAPRTPRCRSSGIDDVTAPGRSTQSGHLRLGLLSHYAIEIGLRRQQRRRRVWTCLRVADGLRAAHEWARSAARRPVLCALRRIAGRVPRSRLRGRDHRRPWHECQAAPRFPRKRSSSGPASVACRSCCRSPIPTCGTTGHWGRSPGSILPTRPTWTERARRCWRWRGSSRCSTRPEAAVALRASGGSHRRSLGRSRRGDGARQGAREARPVAGRGRAALARRAARAAGADHGQPSADTRIRGAARRRRAAATCTTCCSTAWRTSPGRSPWLAGCRSGASRRAERRPGASRGRRGPADRHGDPARRSDPRPAR